VKYQDELMQVGALTSVTLFYAKYLIPNYHFELLHCYYIL